MILPRGLNLVFDEWGAKRRRAACCMPSSWIRSPEGRRGNGQGEHYADSREYRAYQQSLKDQPDLRANTVEKYIQLAPA